MDEGEGSKLGASSGDEIDTSRLLRGIAHQIREVMRRDFGGSSYPPVHHGCMIDQFTYLKPSSFEGSTDSIKAEMWMQEMEKLLVVLNCTEEQKVLFTTFKLAREFEQCWHAMKVLEEQRTYAAKFLELSRFVPSMVLDEYQKVRWFERDLNQRIHEHMACLQIQNFTKLVEKATVAESVLQRELSRFAPSMVPNDYQKIQDFAELVEKATVAELSLKRGTEASERRKRPPSPRSQASVKQISWRGDKDVAGQGSERNDRGRQGDSPCAKAWMKEEETNCELPAGIRLTPLDCYEE
ncbi:uncharacterized protein LOC131167552 [Malania oleifera]|uniref:uncharacterized protein LOC131167552 n=1 Tax=Malania oleifera TaxID=397392 RepID=UPI0025AE9CEF|nr:uncharacterized protein LOC131167552 [Malania oleifera]